MIAGALLSGHALCAGPGQKPGLIANCWGPDSVGVCTYYMGLVEIRVCSATPYKESFKDMTSAGQLIGGLLVLCFLTY